jgi:hypothetical protein
MVQNSCLSSNHHKENGGKIGVAFSLKRRHGTQYKKILKLFF